MKRSQIQRQLGVIETFMAASHECMDGMSQGAPLITLKGGLTKISLSLLTTAAYYVFQKYDMLRCCIERRNDKLYFSTHNDFERIEIEEVTVASEAECQLLYIELLNNALDARHSLWKLVLIKNSCQDEQGDLQILLICHHAIIDTVGFYILLGDILEYLDNSHDQHSLIFASRSIVSNGFPDAVDKFLMEKLPADSSHDITYPGISFSKQATIEERNTQFKTFRLKVSDYKNILTKCCKDTIRINSILSAAICLASYQEKLIGPAIFFKTAVSLRDAIELPQSANKLGCYISVANAHLKLADKSLLTIAQSFEKQLMTDIYFNCLRKQTIELAKVEESIQTSESIKEFNQGLGMTNLGNVDIQTEYKNFKLVDFIPMTKRVSSGNPFVVHLSIFNGEMRAFFVYPSPLMDGEIIQSIGDRFLSIMHDYMRD